MCSSSQLNFIVSCSNRSSLSPWADFIYWRKRLLPVAHVFNGDVQIVMSDEMDYIEELEELGMKDQGNDIVIALWAGKKEKYILHDDFDEDSLTDFIEVSTCVYQCANVENKDDP